MVSESGTDLDLRLNIDGPLLTSTSELATRLQVLFEKKIPKRLRERLLRALEWIGTSVTREHYDDKVVDLCTALECLLTGKDDPKKGEAISLRTMLLAMKLDQNFPHPRLLYRLYGLRSDVVHGSARGVCGRSDYNSLRFIALDVLLKVLELGQKTDTVTSISGVIQIIEDEQIMASASAWLKQWSDMETKTLATYAQSRLDKLVA